ncbi:MAG: ABC transporter ATP-binding protein [Desulfurococcaceae archaeon]
MPEALSVHNLTKVYGNVVGVRNLSFSVREGEVYGLVGPNGSGKTTTLRIVATLLKPTSGDVFVYGVDAVREPLRARGLLAYLPEEAGAYRDLTGLDFIRFMLSLRARGAELERRIADAIEISRLGKNLSRPVRTYSKGMKRILALSVTLASGAKLLVLDEPTSGLDVENSVYVRRLIRSAARGGAAVLMSSHNMLEVETTCDRVGIIYRGSLMAEGSPRELMESTSSRNLEELFMKLIGGEYGL